MREKNGFGLISDVKSEWLSLSPEYVQKINSTPVVELTDAEKAGPDYGLHTPELH